MLSLIQRKRNGFVSLGFGIVTVIIISIQMNTNEQYLSTYDNAHIIDSLQQVGVAQTMYETSKIKFNSFSEDALNKTCHATEFVGKLQVEFNISNEQLQTIATTYNLKPGGKWKPAECQPSQRVAIIIPFLNRKHHLDILLFYLIPILKKQLIDFQIFVVEQNGTQSFNKGRLMNAGFKEATKTADFDCVIFHDVDMIPENDMNRYICGDLPRHMSPAVDKFNYRLAYVDLIGGVLSMTPEVFVSINGYSNRYWGWGAEDDDMALRLKFSNIKVLRPSLGIGRYRMIKHPDEKTYFPLKTRLQMLDEATVRSPSDGISNNIYSVVLVNNTFLFTHLLIDVGTP